MDLILLCESQDLAVASRAVAPKVEPKQQVVAMSRLDTGNFIKHMNGRHADSLNGDRLNRRNFTLAVEETYRAFHRQLHRTRPDLTHEHLPEPPEARIEYAMKCLAANRQWGWFVIAGSRGEVSPFPNGVFATRVDGAIRHHKSAAEAAARLVKDE